MISKGKKLLVALMTLLCAGSLFTVAACGEEPEPTPTPGPGTQTPGGDETPGGGDETPGGGDETPGGGDETPEVDPDLATALKLDAIPASDLTLEATSAEKTAEASWFVEYGTETLDVVVYVEDEKIYTEASVYTSDGIFLYLDTVQRVKGYTDDTVYITASATGDFAVQSAKNMSIVAESGVEATAQKFTLDETKIDGYKIEISIPYALVGVDATAKNAAIAIGLCNAQSGANIEDAYGNEFGADYENVHTYMAVTDTDTFGENPWLPYSMEWGSVTNALQMKPGWNVDGDDGTENAIIVMNGNGDNGDNEIYMRNSNEQTMYAEAKISLDEVVGADQWRKFGLSVTSADGNDGLFFYVDAAATDAGAQTIAENSVALGLNYKNGAGGWAGSWQIIGSMGGTSAQYQNDNFITLGIYRQGAAFSLYFNGNLVKTIGCGGIAAGDDAYVGVAAFKMNLTVKDYFVTTDAAELASKAITPQDVDNLFIGDSYIDKAFWYSFGEEFPNDVNIGVGGTKVEYWTNMAGALDQMYNAPDNIVVHIGVNDIDDGNTTGEVAIERLETMLATYHTLFPEAVIHYANICDNMLFPGKWVEYAKVNAWAEDKAEEDELFKVIDMASVITKVNNSTAHWYMNDGLHYNADGYAAFGAAVKESLGIARAAGTAVLGDLDVQDAPDWNYTAGWTFDADTGVAHQQGTYFNYIGAESQVFFKGAYATDVYAEAKISVGPTNANDGWAKTGIAIRSVKGTYFYFINTARDLPNNNNGTHYTDLYGSIFFRPDVKGSRNWGSELINYTFLGSQSHDMQVENSFKMMGVAKVGAKLYLFADDSVVATLDSTLTADDKVAISIFTFNQELKAKDAYVTTEESAINDKIYGDLARTLTIDGDISDWSDAQKTNPMAILASGNKGATVYATTADDGLYVFVDLWHTTYDATNAAWYLATNVEMRINNQEPQYFASANGSLNGVTQAQFVNTPPSGEETRNHTLIELFINKKAIANFDKASVHFGIAAKTGGDTCDIIDWRAGDFWYTPEADPGMRNIVATENGILTGSAYAIDGDISDWTDVTLETTTIGTSTVRKAITMKEDGVYLAIEIKNASINVATDPNLAWWQHTNIELMNPDGNVGEAWTIAHTEHARVMIYEGRLTHTGRITDAAYTYVDGETEDTLTFEIFFTYEMITGWTTGATEFETRIGGQIWGVEGGATFHQFYAIQKISATLDAE